MMTLETHFSKSKGPPGWGSPEGRSTLQSNKCAVLGPCAGDQLTYSSLMCRRNHASPTITSLFSTPSVKFRHAVTSAERLLFHQKRKSMRSCMSPTCQTGCEQLQQSNSLFNHLVSACE